MSNNYGTGPHPAQFSPPPRANQRNRLFALIAAGVVVVVAAAGVIWAVNRNTSEPTPAATATPSSTPPEVDVIVLEQSDAESENPFTTSVQVAPVVQFPDAVLEVIGAQLKKLTPNPDSGALTGSGAEPGLYGGSNELAVCDVAALGAFLSADTAKATAWAGAVGISVETIPQFLQSLTPLVLLHDTAVTNHGFADGKAVPYQAILQSGTAVLVDPSGQPVVRCACGNPLAPPEPIELDAAEFDGDEWPNFAPEKVVTVEPSESDLDSFTVVDVATGELYERNIGAVAETLQSPGLLVAVGDQISTSPDGITWTVAEGAPSALRIAYGDGLLVAIAPEGEYPDQTTLVYTSSDGITWSEPQSLPAAPADIAYTDGLWAIAGPSQSPPESGITGTIHTSTDGRTWQEKPISVPVANWEVPLDINSLSVAGGVWMIEALSYLGDSDIQTVIRSTDQGASWAVVPYQNPTTGSTFFPLGLQWGWDEKTLVAVGSQLDEVRLDGPSVFSSQAGISTDGSQWSFAPTSPAEAYFSSLTFDAARGWIAAGRVGDYETGTYSVYGSSDLYNWTLLGQPDGAVKDVAVIPGSLPDGYQQPPAGPAPTTATPEAETSSPATIPAEIPTETGPCLYTVDTGNVVELRAITPGDPTCATMTEVQAAAGRGEGTSTGPRTIELFIGWNCAFAPAAYTDETGIAGSCGPADDSNSGFEILAAQASAPAPTAAPPGGGSVPGDLGLSITMTKPTCDGLGIVVLGSAVTPGSYETDIQNFLNAHPGASYLRTDQTCSSLNQATSAGNPIYAVYTVAGYDEASVRAAVCAAGDGAYGKWLDNTTDPSFQIKC